MGITKIHLHGGPKDGSSVDYPYPLPDRVVFANCKERDEKSGTITYYDYVRRFADGLDYDYEQD